MKRLLTSAFSIRALNEQENITQDCIDTFVNKLQDIGTSELGIDMMMWYEMIAFDILGEMAFGESFQCIENEKPHEWQKMIAKHLFLITVVDNLRRYPLLLWLGRTLLPWLIIEVRNKHTNFCRGKIAK